MLIWYGLYDTNVLCFLKKPFNDWFSFLLLVLRYQESAIHRLGGFYYVHDPLNFYHRPFLRPWTVCTKRNASRTKRNTSGTERNVSGTECFAFLRTERFVRFGLVFNFPRYSDFLAWRIDLLFIFATAKWEKSLSHLIGSTWTCVIFFDLKKDL